MHFTLFICFYHSSTLYYYNFYFPVPKLTNWFLVWMQFIPIVCSKTWQQHMTHLKGTVHPQNSITIYSPLMSFLYCIGQHFHCKIYFSVFRRRKHFIQDNSLNAKQCSVPTNVKYNPKHKHGRLPSIHSPTAS